QPRVGALGAVHLAPDLGAARRARLAGERAGAAERGAAAGAAVAGGGSRRAGRRLDRTTRAVHRFLTAPDLGGGGARPYPDCPPARRRQSIRSGAPSRLEARHPALAAAEARRPSVAATRQIKSSSRRR